MGLVSEQGTRTSHAAILAHSIGIPAVFGVPDAVERITHGRTVVVDGSRGTVLLDPTAEELAEAQGREAIRLAFSLARAGDCVLLAGKGHERSIIWGDQKRPWDEAGVAQELLIEMGYGARR